MILCLGTTPAAQRTMIFERLTLDAVNRTKDVRDYASGKSINVARVLHTLGRDAVACGFVGGHRGEFLRHDLDRVGIRYDFVTVAAPTRQCITVIDRAAGTATELVEESSPVDQSGWDALDAKLRAVLPTAKAWVFSGTLAPGASPDFYAKWLPLAHEFAAHAIVDARGEPLKLALRHDRFTVKVNREEFTTALGVMAATDEELARCMVRHVPVGGNLVVTLGAKGALASDRRACWRVAAPPVHAVSAVGSGDAFAAGLAAALHAGAPLPEACRLAAACGAANAVTAYAGHVRSDDVNRLLDQIHVQEL